MSVSSEDTNLTLGQSGMIPVRLTYKSANRVLLDSIARLSDTDSFLAADEVLGFRRVREAEELHIELPNLDQLPSKISALERLRTLSIDSFTLTDLTPIADLIELQNLRIAHTRVTNFAPLASLKNLRTLELIVTPVSDLGFLSDLPELERLNLYGTRVSSLTPFSQSKALRELTLSGDLICELEPLSSLQLLEKLFIYSFRWSLTDLTPVAQNQALRYLFLDNAQVSDLSPLSSLLDLQHVSLNHTRVSDLKPLSGLKHLRSLALEHSAVESLSGLEGAAALEVLRVRGTKLFDLTPLAQLGALRKLDFSKTNVVDLTPLSTMKTMMDKLFEEFSKLPNKKARKGCFGLRYSSTPAARDNQLFQRIYRLKEPARTIETINALRRHLGHPLHYPSRYIPILQDFSEADKA
jgi:Leucine-rich repeat (LRR) protein